MMTLNKTLADFFEMVANADLTIAKNRKKLESSYEELTSKMSREESRAFSRIYKQYLDLKLKSLNNVLSAVEEKLAGINGKSAA